MPFSLGMILADAPGEGVGGAERSEPGSVSVQEQVARWFEESREDVYRYLLLLGLEPGHAQEATQEVFLRVFVAVRRNREEIRNYRAWVFRVAHNLALKARARQGVVASLDDGAAQRLRDPERNPEQALLERERMARLHLSIQGLSEQQRRCLFLRMEGLRYPEIGEALGISASAVGEFLRRAIGRLRKAGHE